MNKTDSKKNFAEATPIKLEVYNEIVRLQDEGCSFKSQIKDYGGLYFTIILYGIGAWIFYAKAKNDSVSLTFFLATIFIVIMFHCIAENRERRRMEILAEILKKLECEGNKKTAEPKRKIQGIFAR